MNKVALVTGGSGGIGKAIIMKLYSKGYNVAFTYNSNQDSAFDIISELNSQSHPVLALQCDISDTKQITDMIDKVITQFGRIDVLVNNSGIAWQGLFTDMTSSEINRILDVNVKGTLNVTYNIIPYMVKKHCGKIINISSMWGQVGASCEVVYSVSKSAVIGFTKALAKELGPSGINVNCICPGVIRTHMLDCYDENTLGELAEETPLGRLGTPEDIAESVYFLSCESSDFITGQIIGVNGGFII